MKALNSTLVAWRAGGRRRRRRLRRGRGEEEEAKFMPPKPFFKKQRTTIARSLASPLSRFGDINVRTNERGTHNKYEFLYCPPAAPAAALAACVAGQRRIEPRTRHGEASARFRQNYEIILSRTNNRTSGLISRRPKRSPHGIALEPRIFVHHIALEVK